MQTRRNRNKKGIDISHWQGQIDWEKVKPAALDFVYIKATEGNDWKDPQFVQNVRGATAIGLKVGAYHFARFKTPNEAALEAVHFADSLVKIGLPSLSLPPALDLETSQGVSPEALSKCVMTFSDELKKKGIGRLMLYTSTWFSKTHLTKALQAFPLWIAHYGVNQPAENGIWQNWTVFQYTDKGSIPGIQGNVDLNEWEESQFQDFVNPSHDLEKKTPHIPVPLPDQIHHASFSLTIKKGDSFWKLETENGWPHGTLQRLNPELDPKKLQIGHQINCPKH